MNTTRRTLLKSGAALAALPFARALPAGAATRDVLVAVSCQTINSLDLHRTGTNRASYAVAINCYDRLVTFGSKTTADGGLSFDYSKIEPELAESWTVSDDGLTYTFTLKDATFQDGTPVTAEDVKWSFDRAVSVGGFPTVQMKAGGLAKPEQFVAVDDKTFVVKLDEASKLSLPDLAVPVPFVLNSKLAKAHASDDDPWATNYVHKNTIGSGAYKVIRWDPGQQIVYERFDGWAGGPKPAMKRVIMREVPSTSTQRALVERGDVQIAFDIPDKDAAELAKGGKVKVESTPIANCINCLCMNFNFEPFQDPDVRKAVAWAVPYQAIFEAAAYKRGAPLWGGPDTYEDTKWPRKTPYDTDLDKAKEFMAKSGYKNGFETTLSISTDLASWMEPTALLIQEAVAKIGIKTTIDKIPGANWRTAALVDKKLPFLLENFGGWLDTPDYYFYWAYLKGHLFNASNYTNPEVEKLFEIAMNDLPRVPLWQPALNVAMNGASGYEFWFHRQLDNRTLTSA